MRTATLLLITSALIACGSSEKSDDDGTTDGTTDDSEPHIVDPPEGDYLDDSAIEELPELDGSALTAAVNDAIANAMYIHGGPAVFAYFEALEDSEGDCPTWGVDNGTPFWFDTCVTESGAAFEGYGYHYEYEAEYDDNVTWDGFAIYSVASIVTAAGDTFEGAGGASFLTGVNDDDLDVWYSYVQPGFAYDGAAADGTWLAEGLDPDTSWYALRAPDGSGAAATMSGSTMVSSGPVSALVFNELLLIDEAWGSSCPIEPHGSLSVLDDEGNWIDVYFDGPEWEGPETPAELCDGCGSAWFRGTYLGEACFDFSPLSDWDAYPFADRD